MTFEQAKRVSEILQKIDRNNEIINNLKFKKTHDIRFCTVEADESTFIIADESTFIIADESMFIIADESMFIVYDKELINSILDHSLHVLTEEIWELEQELKLL